MSFAIQISNLHVAVVFISAELDSESELVIWNWRTGSLEMASNTCMHLVTKAHIPDRMFLAAKLGLSVFLPKPKYYWRR